MSDVNNDAGALRSILVKQEARVYGPPGSPISSLKRSKVDWPHHGRESLPSAPDARRFWGGTPSPIPAAIARHSIAALNEIGIESIREHNVQLAGQLIEGLDPSMLVSPREVARRSGTVVVDPGTKRPELLDRLAKADVHVDERVDGIRVSPHLVNTQSDIETFLQIVKDVCE